MDPISQIQKAVEGELDSLNLNFVLAGVVLPTGDVANRSGFLPFLFEQQQILAELIGVPKKFQPKAFGEIIEDETALLEKRLQVKSEDAVVPLISYLTDAARMTKRLAVDQTVDLGKLLNPDPDTPHFLSAVLDELVFQSAETFPKQPNPGSLSEPNKP